MRVAFLSQRAHPSVGGIENYQWHVATALAVRHEVTIFAERIDAGPIGRQDGVVRAHPAFPEREAQGVTVRPLALGAPARAALLPLLLNSVPGTARLAYGPMRRATAGWFSAVAARSHTYRALAAGHDVIHVWGGDYLGRAACAAGRRHGRPVVITPFAHPGQWGDDPGSADAYRRASAVVGLLDCDAQTYRDLGAPPDRVHVCGVCSPGVAAGGGAELRRQHAIDGPIVLFLGVRRAHKGFDRLLAAAGTIAAARPDATLVFAGPGDPIDAEGCPLRVVDAGLVSDAERAGWLEAADLLCLPSLGEIFPVSILEAFSVGTPVLTSDIPALRELTTISGGGLATAVEPVALGSAIGALLSEPARLSALGASGRAFWRNGHTPQAVAGWYEALYRRLLDRQAG